MIHGQEFPYAFIHESYEGIFRLILRIFREIAYKVFMRGKKREKNGKFVKNGEKCDSYVQKVKAMFKSAGKRWGKKKEIAFLWVL